MTCTCTIIRNGIIYLVFPWKQDKTTPQKDSQRRYASESCKLATSVYQSRAHAKTSVQGKPPAPATALQRGGQGGVKIKKEVRTPRQHSTSNPTAHSWSARPTATARSYGLSVSACGYEAVPSVRVIRHNSGKKAAHSRGRTNMAGCPLVHRPPVVNHRPGAEAAAGDRTTSSSPEGEKRFNICKDG